MISKDHLRGLSPVLEAILESELRLGNSIEHTHLDWPQDGSVFVLLASPFKKKYDSPGAVYQRLDDPQFWFEDYEDKGRRHILACAFS